MSDPGEARHNQAWTAYQDCDHATEFMVCDDCVAKAIAAAEERGRRRGVEERDELRAALKSAAVALNVAEGWLTGLGSHTEAYQVHGWHQKALAALAPRDSAPATDHAKVCDCGGSPSCAFGAPRDSGKAEENRDVFDVEREP